MTRIVSSMDQSLIAAAPPVADCLTRTTTARLDLIPIDMESVDLLAPLFVKEEVWHYPYGRGFSRAETEAFVTSQVEHWDTLGFGLWLASERGSSRVVGYVGLSVPTFLPEVLPAVEVGWRLDPSAWGKGYATEAATAALAGAFGTLRLAEVVSLPQIDNTRSLRVAERIGMRHDRTVTAHATDKRGAVDVAVMVLTVEEWTSSHSQLPTTVR